MNRVLVGLVLAALSNHNRKLGFVTGADHRHVLDHPHNAKPILNDFAKHDMLAIEPIRCITRDEELATVRIGSTVGLANSVSF